MVVLTQNANLTVEEISNQLQMSRRSIYRYIDAFKQMGFIVRKRGTRYSIDHESPFFKAITERIHFSDDEAVTINRVLNSVMDNSTEVRHLREKLSSLYDFSSLANHGIDDHIARNLSVIYKAIQGERVVVLRDYASASSNDVRNRIIEPYLFLAESNEVRGYEIASGQNKTFKIQRAKSVELLDILWANKEKHAPFYLDLFHFTGEQRETVSLRLGNLATNLLLEEYPAAEEKLKVEADGRHRLTTDVCSYKGVGRFVLGLYDDIEVVESTGFKDYLKERAEDLTKKFSE